MSLWIVFVLVAASVPARARPRRKHKLSFGQVAVHAGKPGCSVDLDGAPAGNTNPQGNLLLTEVTPSDHYVHVDCPGQPEITYFVSPAASATLELKPKPARSSTDDASALSSLGAAENNMELRKLVRQAADLRAEGRFPEAVESLRQAVKLDPENPDLHHELGTTFLMIRDWERARVELLEAVRHDPSDADAHNGLGYALEKLNEIRPALDQFRVATHLDPHDDSYRQHYLEALAILATEQPQKKRK